MFKRIIFIEDKDHTPETLAIFAERTRTIIKTLHQMFCSFQVLRDVLYVKGGITRAGIVNVCRAYDQKQCEQKSGDINHLTIGCACDKH